MDAAVEGSRKKAPQCLLLDPVITNFEPAKLILDDYLMIYKEHFPNIGNKLRTNLSHPPKNDRDL
jgi:alpha-galactosidase/6-phospho-beta-glucosidase family protein